MDNDSNDTDTDNDFDIAIVGMSCRFPGASNVDEFWTNLQESKESITFFSAEELIAEGIDPAFLENPNYVRAAPIIEGVELFDADFFGYTPNEAEHMDPQHRIFLECAWECFEHAGYNPYAYEDLIGVYAGAAINSYSFFSELGSGIVNDYVSSRVSCDKDFLATRVSYKLDLRGPSMTVQTSCSTSLVAVHLACQSLLNEECDMALAGGVSVHVPHRAGYLHEPEGIFSPDGHCRAFDAHANGTNFGNGAGIVLLKRLADALNDGDTIHAIIKGTAINNDGASKVGYTAPSVVGQASVIVEAMASADVEAESISYIEAHGTGTQLGDPIEVAALEKAFRLSTDKKQFCAIGSVKTNIGHLDTAAGIAGLIKTTLALKYKHLPATLNYTASNPKIDFNNSPFYVSDHYQEWQVDQYPRRAGVTSLGVGGTNAHVIVEESPVPASTSSDHEWQLLTVSAQTEQTAQTMMLNLSEYLLEHPETDLGNAAYTLQMGRKLFPYRSYVLCNSVQSGIDAISQLPPVVKHCTRQDRPVIFMFPGQGAQYTGMATSLYMHNLEFRHQLDLLCSHLDKLIDFDLKSLLVCADASVETEQLNETWLTQPALFVVEYALARVWMSWGVQPEAMIGHSIGEYVCATLAGVMSVEQALEIVVERARLMQSMPSGMMLAVALSRETLLPMLDSSLSLATVNTPDSCVVAGSHEAITGLQRKVEAQGTVNQVIKCSHAFHSKMMDPLLEPFAAFLERFEFLEPQLPYVSSATGDWITAEQVSSKTYWCQQLRDTVEFNTGLELLLADRERIFLEVGPGRTLQSFLARRPAPESTPVDIISSFRKPWEDQCENRQLVDATGKLWAAGSGLDWAAINPQETHQRIPLPTYPFEHRQFWSASPETIRRLSRPLGVSRSVPADSLAPGELPVAATQCLDDAQTMALDQQQEIGFYFPSWKRIPWQGSQSASRWLLFNESGGVGQAVAKQLRDLDCDVISIEAGSHFAQEEHRFTLDPQNYQDYLDLFVRIRDANLEGQLTIAHFWSVTPAHSLTGEAQVAQALNTGFHSLVQIARAVTDSGLSNVRIKVVSSGISNVSGVETLCPINATLQGACRVIPREFPGIECQLLDISDQQARDFDTQSIRQLIDALFCYNRFEHLALRHGHLWAPMYEPMRVDDSVVSEFRQGGTYLITGGLGGIGMEIAESLMLEHSAKVVLVGRSSFPVQETWDDWLSDHDHDDEVAKRVVKLRAMAAGAGQVHFLTADVTDMEQMRAAIEQTEALFGPINGVIHAAGLINDGAMILKSRQELEEVLAPKVLGTLVLYHLLAEKSIDFLILMSSLASILGNFGQSDYTAANSFLDAFAQAHADSPFPVLAINWPAWRSVGVAARNSADQDLLNDQSAIATSAGIQALYRALNQHVPQVFLATGPMAIDLFGGDPHESQIHTMPALELDIDSQDPATFIMAVWREVLGVKDISNTDMFADLGGDSLTAIRVVSQIKERFQIQVSLGEMLEAETIAEQAEIVHERQAEAAASGDNVELN